MKDYLKFWRLYSNFKGRSTKSEFFNALLWFILTNLILMIGLAIILIACFGFDADKTVMWVETITRIYDLAALIPMLAITSRRLHDAGYSMKSLFWLLIPGFGLIALLARLCLKSNTEPKHKNK